MPRPLRAPTPCTALVALLATLLACSAVTVVHSAVVSRPLRALVIAPAAADAQLPAVQEALQGHDIPFTTVLLFPDAGSPSTRGPTLELEAAGLPLYGAIVRVGALDGLTTAEESALATYESAHGVRVASCGVVPAAASGMANPPSGSGGTVDDMWLSFASSSDAASHGHTNDMAVLADGGVTKWPAPVASPAVATPLFLFGSGANSGGSTSTVAASVVVPGAGRLHLELYFSLPSHSLCSTVAAGVMVRWAFGDVYAGARRLQLSMQVQDVFLAEFTYQGGAGSGALYRATATDLNALAAAQAAVTAKLPGGSDVRFELAFAGGGVDQGIGRSADSLYVESQVLRDRFYWVQSGYTGTSYTRATLPHLQQCFQSMTCSSGASTCVGEAVTQAAVACDVAANAAFGDALFGADCITNTGAAASACDVASPRSFVTPATTGLFNPAALAALASTARVDTLVFNSACNAVSQSCDGVVATPSRFDAGRNGTFWLLPMVASDIYYNSATEAQNVAQFQARNVGTPQASYTMPQILDSVAAVGTQLVLGLRHDVHLLHQANLARSAYSSAPETSSLAAQFASVVADAVAKVSTLPLRSLPMDQLADQYRERATRAACNYSAEALVDDSDGRVIGLRARSTTPCRVGFTGFTGIAAATITIERYGPDVTTWVALPGGSTEVTIAADLPVAASDCSVVVTPGSAVNVGDTVTFSVLVDQSHPLGFQRLRTGVQFSLHSEGPAWMAGVVTEAGGGSYTLTAVPPVPGTYTAVLRLGNNATGAVVSSVNLTVTAGGQPQCSGHGQVLATPVSCACAITSDDGSSAPSCHGTCAPGAVFECCSCTCVDGYAGLGCEAQCPTGSGGLGVCSGRGTCDSVTAKCQCSAGFYGPACGSVCPGSASQPCNGHGTCDGETGVCSCVTGYHGSDCGSTCPGGPATPCSGHGTCLGDGSCVCDVHYFGTDCGTHCFAEVTCNGGGACQPDGTCLCGGAFGGPTCAIGLCGVGSACNNRGTCGDNGCTCDVGYYGSTCESQCPGWNGTRACSGHGGCGPTAATTCCADGTCLCESGYWGSDCSADCLSGSPAPTAVAATEVRLPTRTVRLVTLVVVVNPASAADSAALEVVRGIMRSLDSRWTELALSPGVAPLLMSADRTVGNYHAIVFTSAPTAGIATVYASALADFDEYVAGVVCVVVALSSAQCSPHRCAQV